MPLLPSLFGFPGEGQLLHGGETCGKLKYGLSGSMVMYIDNKYGRNKLKELLKFNAVTDILNTLGTSETNLLGVWRIFIEKS
jgi:hypothetical protein